MKNVGKTMMIVGMFIGSGFVSGKEIAVFFSRFGNFSYIFIPLAFILFFAGIFWILSHGERAEEKFNSSKSLIFISILVNLIFTSSMMAGTIMSLKTKYIALTIVLILALLFLCYRVIKKGMGYLTKVNTILIPILIIVLLICLLKNAKVGHVIESKNAAYAGFFAILYILMNLSSSCLVIGKLGSDMSKKSRIYVSLFASLILTVLLLGINYTLLSNENSLDLTFPLLEMSEGYVFYLMKFVLFIGCLTSVLSIVFVNSKALLSLGLKGFLNYLVCVCLPLVISMFGFGNIVSYLYPLASILGGLILVSLYFVPYKKLQYASKK